MGRYPSSEACPVLVILPGNKGFHLIQVRFPHPGKLPDLHDPVPLQLLRRRLVIHIRQVQAVRVPFAAQLRDQRTLPDPLIPVQNNHAVKLDSRMVHPAVSRAQLLPCNCPNIWSVLRPKIIDQQRIRPLYPVPSRKRLKELPDRMVGPVIHSLRNGDIIIPGRKCPVCRVHIADQLGVIRVTPELGRMRPGNVSPDLHTVRQLVEHNPLQVLIILQDQHKVMQVILKFHTLLFILKLLLPRVRIRFIKILRCRLPLFLKDTEFHPLIRHGEFGHCIIGLFRVIIRELMHPHRVKSVQQLPAGRIRRVEAVGKLLINDDDAGGTVCGDIVISPFHCRRRVNIRQELFNRFPDRISTAESPHHAGLCQRVRLLFRRLLHRCRFPGRYRPGGNVPPVIIKPQVSIRIQEIAVHDPEHILPV